MTENCSLAEVSGFKNKPRIEKKGRENKVMNFISDDFFSGFGTAGFTVFELRNKEYLLVWQIISTVFLAVINWNSNSWLIAD